MRLTIRTYLFVVMLAVFSSCGGDKSNTGNPDSMDTARGEGMNAVNGDARIITLPTPMQIPALLKNTEANYSPVYLLDITTDQKSYPKSGILFGMYMLDMAYASSFSHQQASMQYFKACKDLGDQLGLATKIKENHLKRFESNLSKPDSLGRIILEMYDLGHKVLLDQDKEGLGFLMVMGCYMEGMNLVMNQAREHDLILFVHLLQQQRNYGLNLRMMLDGYKIPTEISAEYEHFSKVIRLLEDTNIPSVYELKTGTKTIAGMKRENLEQIKDSIDKFRKSILI